LGQGWRGKCGRRRVHRYVRRGIYRDAHEIGWLVQPSLGAERLRRRGFRSSSLPSCVGEGEDVIALRLRRVGFEERERGALFVRFSMIEGATAGVGCHCSLTSFCGSMCARHMSLQLWMPSKYLEIGLRSAKNKVFHIWLGEKS